MVTETTRRHITVDIAECKISNDSLSILETYALGGCVAVLLYDPVAKIGGLLHYMLPHSRTAPHRAKERPAIFADTGIPRLLEQMGTAGSNLTHMVCKAAGGGKLFADTGVFDIGQRNVTMLHQMCWRHELFLAAEDMGDTKSRMVALDIATGDVTIRAGGKEWLL